MLRAHLYPKDGVAGRHGLHDPGGGDEAEDGEEAEQRRGRGPARRGECGGEREGAGADYQVEDEDRGGGRGEAPALLQPRHHQPQLCKAQLPLCFITHDQSYASRKYIFFISAIYLFYFFQLSRTTLTFRLLH